MNPTPTITSTNASITPEAVCQELLGLLKKFKSHMATIAESHGLTTMQLHALHAIAEGYATMGKVAQTMHCDASNVTGIIDRLTALKLVTRQEDPRDRRVKTLQLTPHGKAILQQVIDELPVRLGCSRLSGPELSSLHGTIAKLVAD
jgi:DNA-binding MarR family transcriptional regulator